jgi:hypothetical protein
VSVQNGTVRLAAVKGLPHHVLRHLAVRGVRGSGGLCTEYGELVQECSLQCGGWGLAGSGGALPGQVRLHGGKLSTQVVEVLGLKGCR